MPLAFILHRGDHFNSKLDEVLSGVSENSVREPEHEELCVPGVYLAPTGYHLLIGNDNRFYLDFSEKVKHSRPSIDVSFDSFSAVFREGLTAVVLSGANSDGAEGARRVVERGGKLVVIDPKTVRYRTMPDAVIEYNNGTCEIMSVADIIKNLKKVLG